ncbi:hypothetical protein AB3S75_033834 [Citrus x aurantiifolia]
MLRLQAGMLLKLSYHFPVNSDSEIVSEFRKALQRGKTNGRKVRLAMIDHVTSIPSVLIPVKELIKICPEEGVHKVFVDGAHGIGKSDETDDLHHPVVSQTPDVRLVTTQEILLTIWHPLALWSTVSSKYRTGKNTRQRFEIYVI